MGETLLEQLDDELLALLRDKMASIYDVVDVLCERNGLDKPTRF